MADGQVTTQQTTEPAAQPAQAQQIDYGKLEEILNKKAEVTEKGVMKSFFKEQGLSEEEAKQAMADFKKNQETTAQESAAHQSQVENELEQLKAQVTQAKINESCYTLASELNVDMKNIPYVVKLADFKDVVDEQGAVKDDALKAAINKVLEDIPALKNSAEGGAGRLKVGGAGGQSTADQNDQLAAIFGNIK
ncbi:hypothetical protein SAMN04515656_10337 [Eubacterium aggregans]|uniref:Uncharacterized protein n=1 Tax=Eubacterium aggregans TaxID=81409 RepID=A0A1H3Y2N6_9FIRM|nr:hypothetical protein [Eubacterium aggregans]SEA05833.1 hypothetical protein SAMN04515656_10337 [Eubacterium aggregans]